MARDLEITVVVNDQGAKQKLGEIDQAFDQTTAKATTAATAITVANATLEAGGTQATAYKRQVLDAASGMDTFKVSTVEADRYLSQLHIDMQKLPGTFAQLRTGLNEVATGAGLTVEGLGLLNAAGLVIGTGYAAWRIGTIINDLTGLDALLAKNSLQGWALQAQEAAAKSDTLAKASASAGYEIRDMAKAVEELTRVQKLQSEQAARNSAPGQNAADRNAIFTQVNELKASGAWANLAKDIEAGLVPLNTLVERYRILPGVITVMKEQQKAFNDEVKQSVDSANRYQAYVDEWINKMKQRSKDEDDARKKREADQAREQSEILRFTREINKEYDTQLLKHDAIIEKLQTQAHLAEFQAKQANMGQFGVDENGAPLGMADSPAAKAQRGLDELKRQESDPATRRISTTERQQQIQNTFLKAMLDEATAADGAAKANSQAAAAAGQLSSAHMGAVQAVGDASNALSAFRGILVGTVDAMSPGQAGRNAPLTVSGSTGMYTGAGVGQFGPGSGVGMAGAPLITSTGRALGLTNELPHFGGGGYAPSPMQAVVGDSPGGEYMIPAKQMEQWSAARGGVTVGDIHIHGDVASESSVRIMTDRVANRILDRVSSKQALR